MAKEVEYSVKVGLWKTLKNTLVVLVPASIAAWAAFVTNAPAEYQPVLTFVGGFVGYFVKNWFQFKG